jgi:hypothetical protein
MNRAALTAATLLETEEVSETAKTWKHLPAVFFGTRCPPHSAELPLPDQRVVGSSAVTVDERTPVRRS